MPMKAKKKKEYRELADKMRALEAATANASEREMFVAIAESYERMIVEIDSQESHRPPLDLELEPKAN